MQKGKLGKLAVLLLALVVLSGCLGFGTGSISGLPSAQQAVLQNWITITFITVFGMFMAVGLLYTVGTGFGIPSLQAWCKNELFQLSATAIMVFMLVFAITGADQISKSFTGTGQSAMERAQDYMLCQSQFIWGTYNYLLVTSAPMSILYSSTIHIRPLRMGFSLQPAKFLQPVMDNLGIAINMLTSATWASRLVYYLLLFAQDTMLAIFLPLGVLLRAFPVTRSIGGALIAMAAAFYIALPGAVLINAMIYQEHYGAACIAQPVAPTLITPFVGGRIQALAGGWTHYALGALVEGTGGKAAAIFGKMGTLTYILMAISFGGLSGAAIPWLLSGVLVGALTALMLAWAREVIFIVVILGFGGLVVDYMITFTFARELSRVLGSDVNLSALMKIL
ncbi:Uncharacterised protein [Candidatus Burarchaeum australiense]|nr:Uncharacterised protein [Candidatus Burarchaeum australiense]